MPVNPNRWKRRLVLINLCAFLFLIAHLNFNIRTFRLTQELQLLTIQLQDLERDVEEKEVAYYEAIRLDKVYEYATTTLNMYRQNQPMVYSPSVIQSR